MNPNQNLTPLFNPLNEDFSWDILDDDNIPHTYTMKFLDISYFEPHIANLMLKHLADKLFQDRDGYKSPEIIRQQIEAEIKG